MLFNTWEVNIQKKTSQPSTDTVQNTYTTKLHFYNFIAYVGMACSVKTLEMTFKLHATSAWKEVVKFCNATLKNQLKKFQNFIKINDQKCHCTTLC